MDTALAADARDVDAEFALIVAQVDLAVTAKLDPFSEPVPEREKDSPESTPSEKETERPREKPEEDER